MPANSWPPIIIGGLSCWTVMQTYREEVIDFLVNMYIWQVTCWLNIAAAQNI